MARRSLSFHAVTSRHGPASIQGPEDGEASIPGLLDAIDEGRGAAAFVEEIGRAVAEDGCGAIVLGCAGMALPVRPMAERHGVMVVDGVATATGFAAAPVAARDVRAVTSAAWCREARCRLCEDLVGQDRAARDTRRFASRRRRPRRDRRYRSDRQSR